jgi:alpha,alpha-trehalase
MLTALPHALDTFVEIERRVLEHRVALFLDYDGTLTPIVARPELATLSADMRRVMASLAGQIPVAVVSGRDRSDVEKLVGIEPIIYAGSHGFDISGPDGLRLVHSAGSDASESLDEAAGELRKLIEGIAGALVERKRFALTVHFRLVAPADQGRVLAAFERVAARYATLRVSGGKCVYELRPAIDWNKGAAVIWLLDRLGLDGTDALPIYIGDDETDEDALAAVAQRGIGILVTDDVHHSRARYYLRSPAEVGNFLRRVQQVVGQPK